MNCKECGRQIPDGALFCKYCGAQVEKQAAETEDVAAPIQHPRRRAKKKRGPKPAAILAILLILAAGVAAGVLIWKNSGQTPGSDTPPAEVQAPTVTASISPRNSQVEVGSSLVLSTKLSDTAQTPKSITWQSSDTTIATVSDGIVRGVAPGQVQITAKLALESGKSIETETTVRVVSPSVVYTLSVTPADVSLHVGDATRLETQLDPAPEADVTAEHTDWVSDNTAVATIADGRVTGVAVGTAKITVTLTLSNGQAVTASVPVTVTQQPAPAQTPENNTQTQQPTQQQPAQQQPQAPTPAQPSQSQGASTDYILPASNTALVSYDTLRTLSDWQLRLARNEIYARHGRRFNDAQLQAYFDGKSWYHGTIAPDAFDASVLNDTELANITRIQEVEAQRK